MENSKFVINYRVYYEDTDAGGVVYYANYLKFFERARTDFLRSIGISQNELSKSEKLLFVVKKCEVEYLSSVKLDDVLSVEVEILKIGVVSLIIHQKIYCNQNLTTKMLVEIVAIDAENHKPKRIPQNLKNLLIKS
ncbi:MAG: tol-pal system-associated acyl-CoA thioesterase [Rickettsiales bacterium]|nr:tol-pal system-associated acyl-CoA thioesterase [Rickettsiales bacterium]